MNKEEIMKILPHREDMLLIDDAENIDGTAVAHYRVKGDEFFLRGHFPGNPVVPGVILCEIMAQSACVLLKDVMTENTVPMYTGMNNVRFRNPVKPRDLIEIRSSLIRVKHPFYFAEGKITVNGKLCTSAEFSFAVVKKEE